MKGRGVTWLFTVLGFALVVFLLLPLLTLFFSASPARLFATVLDPVVWHSILLTLHMGMWATLIGLALGVPLAYVLARERFPGKWLIEGLVDLPLVLPHTAAGIALLGVFGRNFYGGQAFDRFGIHFVGARPGIVIAMLFVSVPILVQVVREAFASVDPRFEQVALNLGASRWQAFWTVSLPLARRSVLTGALMMWARGISEFGAIFVLVYHPMVAPVLIWNRLETFGLDYATPVAMLLLLLAIVILLLLRALGVRAFRGGPR